MTHDQPTGWRASEGIAGSVGNTPEDPFVGELKCFEVNGAIPPDALLPINANDLIGKATIEEVTGGAPGSVDARTYSAIGVPAVLADGSVQGDEVLCLGSNSASSECAGAEYASCPSTLILNHFFDNVGAVESTTTDLTLVPCTENIVDPDAQPITAVQFLVFNEFEQRLSGSLRISCFKETRLSNIDRRVGQELSSIFNVALQGTLAGQTRIRPVTGSETDTGHGLLALAEEFRTAGRGEFRGSAAFNVGYAGTNDNKADFIRFLVK